MSGPENPQQPSGQRALARSGPVPEAWQPKPDREDPPVSSALLLSRSEITALLDVPSVLGILRRGFTEATKIQPLRIRTDPPGPGTATALLPGLIPGVPAYTVKVNAKFPDASPALRGLVCLHDRADGGLLAVLDSASVTAWRTGLAAGLATDVLAAADATSVSVIGAGAQAAMVLRGLAALRPLTSLTVNDIDTTRASGFAQDFGISTNTVESPQEAADRGEIVVLATWSRTPLMSATSGPGCTSPRGVPTNRARSNSRQTSYSPRDCRRRRAARSFDGSDRQRRSRPGKQCMPPSARC
jgi:hypothetical protein